MSVLVVEDLAKAFGGVRAVDGVSFTLGPRELLAMIGPNGAGKSTCFNMVGGQLRPDRGRVAILGRDTVGWPSRRIWRLGVGRTFQITATFASMTVRENVQTALLSRHRRLGGLWRFARDLYREEADAVLYRVGMADQADRAAGVLAYGDLKRLELAVALANDPTLLLMDEPTAGMAPGERRDLMALAARIVKEQGVSVLFTEHDMDVVFGHADRVLVLDRGRVVTEGPPAAVRDDPEVRRIYLGGTAGRAGREGAA
ncbi:MAG: ABC transporter ATP-binding protein [Azospirillaceae bacterium]